MRKGEARVAWGGGGWGKKTVRQSTRHSPSSLRVTLHKRVGEGKKGWRGPNTPNGKFQRLGAKKERKKNHQEQFYEREKREKGVGKSLSNSWFGLMLRSGLRVQKKEEKRGKRRPRKMQNVRGGGGNFSREAKEALPNISINRRLEKEFNERRK